MAKSGAFRAVIGGIIDGDFLVPMKFAPPLL
jgi:hypothetical protein